VKPNPALAKNHCRSEADTFSYNRIKGFDSEEPNFVLGVKMTHNADTVAEMPPMDNLMPGVASLTLKKPAEMALRP
jgi:hypothetical protein